MLVPGSFAPIFHYVPVGSEYTGRIQTARKTNTQPSNVNQLGQFMREAPLRQVFIREVVLLYLSGDASLECAFNHITGQIISAWIDAIVE